MTIPEILLAIFGTGCGLTIAGLVLFDCWLVITGRLSLSRRLAAISHVYPIIPAVIGLVFGFVVGCLAGHWWFPL